MASGYKDGPPPDRLYVLKNAYEIRYYTTPETYAQAIVEGYAQGNTELAVYRRCETPPNAAIDEILAANPFPDLDTSAWPMPPQFMMGSHPLAQPTPAQKAAYQQYEKDQKTWRKHVKGLLLTILGRY